MGKNKRKGPKGPKPQQERKMLVAEEQPVEQSNAVSEAVVECVKIDHEGEIAVVEKTDHTEVEELHAEVERLKLQLESKNADNGVLKVQEERDYFQEQYNMLLSRLSSMKSLFSKIKESQLELENTQEQLAEYESQNISLKKRVDSLVKENQDFKSIVATLNQELASLNSECEKLGCECSRYKTQADNAQNMLEEAVLKHNKRMQEKFNEIKTLQTRIQEVSVVIDDNKLDIATMQAEIQDYQEQIKQLKQESKDSKQLVTNLNHELNIAVARHEDDTKTMEDKITYLQNRVEEISTESEARESTIKDLQSRLEIMKEEVVAKEKLEQECKQHMLQIGKLRHEAIILNEHLKKALALIKHSGNSEYVDKELISNLLISFVSIPRADPKKFEVLELISSFLNWNDDKKIQAGLINSVCSDLFSKKTEYKENFVSLWMSYLEKESEN